VSEEMNLQKKLFFSVFSVFFSESFSCRHHAAAQEAVGS
jgi:hypothetical protein